MARWRVGVAVLLAAVLGWPLLEPLAELALDPAGWAAWRDAPRFMSLAHTTAALVAGVLAIDLPLGTLLAVLLYRSDLPGRAALRRLAVVALFVPLPLLTSAWQAALGGGGWLPAALRDWFGPENAGRPWASGLAMAVWVHAAAGLPWVVWLVGQGLCWVEREAEEDALLTTDPVCVLLRVTLPRARGAVLAAAAWVALLTAHEITVTDMTQVRTFAEEVYTQFVMPDPAAGLAPDVSVARAVAVALPGVLLVALTVGWAVVRWEDAMPPLGSAPEPWPLITLGRGRWVWLGLVLTAGAVFLVVPIGSLVWKLGLDGVPEAWSASAAGRYLRRDAQAHARLITESLAAAAATGLLAAGAALVACWLARDGRWLRALLAAVVALAWAAPGPVAGAGLKAAIERLVGAEEEVVGRGPAWLLLYGGPSLVPVVWAGLLRFFPCAVALVWPAVRLVPAALTDVARVDGAPPTRELRHAVWPLAAAAVGRAAVAVAVLSLGELSASKLVATPGGETFAQEVFTRMHYGVANQLAALCLLLLAMVVPPAAILALWRGRGA
jgi:iron(III) transport system permease protein